eukprot:SM000003S11105  [mRNA]  locus=s3:911806:916731:- [translate_table: standard]
MHRLLLLCCFLGAASLTTDCPRKVEVSVAGQDLKEIDAYLAERSASVVTTLKGEGENDIYDCVNITQQYSLRHPSMKNHKVQMKPSKLLNITLGPNSLPPSKKEACPKGTIPVLRHGAKAVLAAGSVAAYMARYPTGVRSGLFDTVPEGAEKPAAAKNTTDPTGFPVLSCTASSSGTVAEFAVGTYGPTRIYGATAGFNIYAPYVQSPSEFSSSQMWLLSGSASRGDLTVIQAGWEDAKTGNWWLYIGKYTEAVSVGLDLNGYTDNPYYYNIDGYYDDSDGGQGAVVLFGGQGYNTDNHPPRGSTPTQRKTCPVVLPLSSSSTHRHALQTCLWRDAAKVSSAEPATSRAQQRSTAAGSRKAAPLSERH